GGVEFYWELKNKKIIAWQCKFHQSALTSGQWHELDQDVKKAIQKYPELDTYIVAIPQDMPQGRDYKKKSFRNKWEEKVALWKKWAAGECRKIRFEYFGDSEIFDFLDRRDQEGRRWYWFSEESLTS